MHQRQEAQGHLEGRPFQCADLEQGQGKEQQLLLSEELLHWGLHGHQGERVQEQGREIVSRGGEVTLVRKLNCVQVASTVDQLFQPVYRNATKCE
jgi:uncharacterized protein (UPF0548 family)